MKKMMHYGKLLALAGLVGIVSAEAGGSAYFYRRTMMRYNAKTERTMKMSGVDWEQYFSKMKECREWMMEQPHEDVWIRSEDSLKLHGTYFQGAGNVSIYPGIAPPIPIAHLEIKLEREATAPSARIPIFTSI